MSGKRIGVLLLATAAAWSTQGLAQAGKPDSKAALERDQAALNQQISTRQQQIAALRAKPGPEQAELAAAQKALDAARAAHQSAGNDETAARLNNAEFKFTLAQRKFNKANAELDVLGEEIDQLQRQLTTRQQQLKALEQKSTDQTSGALQQRLAEERARRQEQELLRTRQEAETQQREIERLKALLAAKEQGAKSSTSEPAKPTPLPTAAAATASTTGLYKIASRQEMLLELQRLEKRLESLGSRGRGGVNEALYLKPKTRQVNNKDRITLHALGLEQYRGETRIEPGDYELILGLNRWPLRIDDSERGAFVFLYDNSEAGKPQLVLYNRLLENDTPN